MSFETFLADILAGIFSAAIFAFCFFLIREKCFGMWDIEGVWYFEMKTESSAYNPFKGMVLRYKVIIWRSGSHLSGTFEKIYENSVNGEREFTGKNRTRGKLDGYYEKRYFSRKDRASIHGVEQGHGREYSSYISLEVDNATSLEGDFRSTAGDQFGTCKCQRNPF